MARMPLNYLGLDQYTRLFPSSAYANSPIHGDDQEAYADPLHYQIHPTAQLLTEMPPGHDLGATEAITPVSLSSNETQISNHLIVRADAPAVLPLSAVSPNQATPTAICIFSQSSSSLQGAQPHYGRAAAQERRDLLSLEQEFRSSPWLAANSHEPRYGDPDTSAHGDQYGIRGKSCYSVFVERKNDGSYGCRHGSCDAYSVRDIEAAITHQRAHHFKHKPFICGGANGVACGKRFSSSASLQAHTRRSH